MNKYRLNAEFSSHKGTCCPFNGSSGVIKHGIDRRKEGGACDVLIKVRMKTMETAAIDQFGLLSVLKGGDEKGGRLVACAK
jgi:hypothetical protein